MVSMHARTSVEKAAYNVVASDKEWSEGGRENRPEWRELNLRRSVGFQKEQRGLESNLNVQGWQYKINGSWSEKHGKEPKLGTAKDVVMRN